MSLQRWMDCTGLTGGMPHSLLGAAFMLCVLLAWVVTSC
jgi:hypothetical protein